MGEKSLVEGLTSCTVSSKLFTQNFCLHQRHKKIMVKARIMAPAYKSVAIVAKLVVERPKDVAAFDKKSPLLLLLFALSMSTFAGLPEIIEDSV